VEQLLLE